MLFNSYSYEILYEQFHWIYLQGDIKLLLVTVNNRLKFEIGIVHDLSCHPIDSPSVSFLHFFGKSHCAIGVNAAGDAGVSPAIYGQSETKCLISPQVWQNCYQIACRTEMRTVQPSFAVQARHRGSQRESMIVLVLHELWRHPLRTFRLRLHVGINARWASVTDFLL